MKNDETSFPIEVSGRPGQPLGMPLARFLRDYWQKRPLLVRGAFKDFRNPVEPNDLAGLACEDMALSRIVLEKPPAESSRRNDAVRTDVNDSQWELRTGPFAEEDFGTLPPTHWTLLVQDVDKWDADVAALLPHFSFLPSWRVDDVMISYAEDGGSVGAHVDQYDVFLLQGLGRRRWQIDAARPHPFTAEDFRDDTELKLLREFSPTHDWVLEPGDLLYLPPGVPHHGVAQGACMTYSIGMRAPSQSELLADFADSLAESLPEEARLSDADLAPSRGDGEIDDAAMERVKHAMPWFNWARKDKTLDDGLRAWFGRFITRYRSAQIVAPNPRRLTDATLAKAVDGNASAQRNPWSRCAWMRHGRAARLFVAGETRACSISFARLFCSQPEFALGEVAEADRAVLRELVDAGHLALVRPRSRR